MYFHNDISVSLWNQTTVDHLKSPWLASFTIISVVQTHWFLSDPITAFNPHVGEILYHKAFKDDIIENH